MEGESEDYDDDDGSYVASGHVEPRDAIKLFAALKPAGVGVPHWAG